MSLPIDQMSKTLIYFMSQVDALIVMVLLCIFYFFYWSSQRATQPTCESNHLSKLRAS